MEEKPIYEATNWVAERVETAERQDQQCTQKRWIDGNMVSVSSNTDGFARKVADSERKDIDDGGSVMVSLQRAQTCGGDGSREQLLEALERAEVVGGDQRCWRCEPSDTSHDA